MRIGLIGGTGPAGSALGARLASVGYEVVIGSRTLERAQEVCAEMATRWPDHALSITPGDNTAAAMCDVVVLATPWDSAATTAKDLAGPLQGK
ncbi:MAG: NAD(P)-binding domain-containing protein, partial [Ilumatobacteraceae bacterium]|nr:NAD(P)-binding domain-containing protein [Ilumatobacteraceae bacterium]